MAQRLEDSLYRRASSLAQYSNVETLKKRLQEVAVNMSKRKQMQPRKIPLEKIDAQAIQHYAQKFDPERRKKFLSLPLMQQKEYIVKLIYRKHQLQLQRAQEQVRGANGKVDPVKLKQFKERRRAELLKQRASNNSSSNSSATSTTTNPSQVVNMNDINPFLSAPSKAQPKTKTGAAAASKKKSSRGGRDNNTKARSQAVTTQQRQQVLRQQQQRLLLLRHASKCDAGTKKNPGECKATKHCRQMKLLWAHIAKCKDPQCTTPHCVSSRYVLSHYHRCKDQNCRVCSPVRDAIQRHKDKSKRQQSARGKAARPKPTGKGKQSKASAARGKAKTTKVSKNARAKAGAKSSVATKVTLRRPNIRRFSTSMITGFTKSQIEKHIKSLQTDFSSSYTAAIADEAYLC